MDGGVRLMELDDELDFEFTLAEIAEMGNLYNQMGKKFVTQQMCEELANKFSCSPHRHEKSCVKWEQVYDWFKDIKRASESRILSLQGEDVENVDPTNLTEDTYIVKKEEDETSLLDMVLKKDEKSHRGRKTKNLIPFLLMMHDTPPKPREEIIAELPELIFEAKSSRDLAWYDVAAFLNYRITYLGDLEVRVRFNGFDNDHDEWVNVKNCVRERSIPLEPSECQKVNVGDLVLCYRDGEDFTLYCDAYIVGVQRNAHGKDACSCIFFVQYDYDNFEEQVPVSKLCCRPAKEVMQGLDVA